LEVVKLFFNGPDMIGQSSGIAGVLGCQSAPGFLRVSGLPRPVHAATPKLYPLLWCVFAICPPAGLALVTLDTFMGPNFFTFYPSYTILYYYMSNNI